MTTTIARGAPAELRLHDGVRLGPAVRRGPRTIHLVRDARAGRTYEIGPREYFVFSRLDGRSCRTAIEIAYGARFHARLDDTAWQQLVTLLRLRDLLATDAAPATTAPPTATSTGRAQTPTSSTDESALSGKHAFGDPARLLARLDRRLGWAFHPAAAWSLLIIAVATQVVIWTNLAALTGPTIGLMHRPLLLVSVIVVLWVSLVLHEFAHGLVGLHVGARPTEIGISWKFPAMALYCTVADLLLVRSRRDRVATALAGVLTNLLVLVPVAVVWVVWRPSGAAGDVLGATLLFGSVAALANGLPVFGLDGARALGHALGVADLSSGGRGYATAMIGRDRAALASYRACPRWLRRSYLMITTCETALLVGVLASVAVVLLRLGGVTETLFLTIAGALAGAAVLGGITYQLASASRPPAPPAAGPSHRASEKQMTTTSIDPIGHVLAPDSPATKTATAIDATGIRKAYGDTVSLDGVELHVRSGEFFGILGPNGAGKTTLIEILEGLRDADSGDIRVLDLPPIPRTRALLRRIGVQRQASAFFPRLTAREHLRTVAALYGASRQDAEETLAAVGLAAVANTRADKLSGGQQQRLAIAAALTHRPDLVFLDEPTAALDPHGRRELWRLLRTLKADGRTIIYTTHHLDEAEALCDRVAILERGRIIALDRPAALVRSRGDRATVSLPAGRISPDQAARVDGADGAHQDGDRLVIDTAEAGSLLTALAGLGVDLDGVQVTSTTLEDVYLELTGEDVLS